MADRYELIYKKSVDKDLRKLPKDPRKKIVEIIQGLAISPLPHGVTKIKGSLDLFRLRHSDYRIIYRVDGNKLYVLIVKVGHRRDVYRYL